MKRWLDIILLVILMILILPSLVVGLFSKRKPHEPGPHLEYLEEGEDIRITEPVFEGKEYIEPTITLYNHYNKTFEPLPLEEYIVGVVAAEMPASFEMEALKAQAVAARTLAAKKFRSMGGGGCTKHKGSDVCSQFSHCQAWIPDAQQRKNWGSNYETNVQKIKQAVEATRGEIMTFDGTPIQVFFYSTSNGKTEDVNEVFSNSLPYYGVVDSPGEESGLRYRETKNFSGKEFVRIFKSKYPKSSLSPSKLRDDVKIIGRTNSGRVRDLDIGGIRIKATDFRVLYGLNSTDFSFRFEGDNIYIDTIGYGHGVGMSQVGANVMAEAGQGYREILNHYYIGIEIRGIQPAD